MAKVNGNLTILGSLAMNSTKITSLANGTASSDAVNLGQVQNLVNGLSWKQAVRLGSNANIASLTGITASDFDGTGQGVTLATDDRVLLKAQTAGAENGIYVYDGADLVRAEDMNSGNEADGAAVFVQEGTDADKAFQQTTDSVTIGTTAQVWVNFSSSGTLNAGDGIDIAANVVSVDLKASAGLKIDATELAVEPADFAGAGLEDDGSDNLRIAASAAGDGLTGGGGSALAVNPADFAGNGLEEDSANDLKLAFDALTALTNIAATDEFAFFDADEGTADADHKAITLSDMLTQLAGDGIKTTGTALNIEPADFAGSGLEDDGSDNLRIAAAAAGDGLTGGAGSALSVQANGSTIAVAAGGISVSQITSSDAVTGVRTHLADWISTDGTTKAITHSFGTKDVMVEVFDYTDNATFIPDSVVRTNTNTVTLTANTAPSGTTVGTDTFRVMIKEIG